MKFNILRNLNVFEILILMYLKVWLYFTLLMFSYFLSTSFLIFLSHRHIVNDSMKIFLKIFLSCSVIIDSTYFWNIFGASYFKISACFLITSGYVMTYLWLSFSSCYIWSELLLQIIWCIELCIEIDRWHVYFCNWVDHECKTVLYFVC